jgi:5-methylcytosine-specific restriction endonuclease McrA
MSIFGPDDYDRIFKRDEFKCMYCGFSGKGSFENWLQLTIDHIRPLRFIEDNSDENLATCCNYCNLLTNRIPEYDETSKDLIKEMKRKRVKQIHDQMRSVWERSVRSV